MLSKFKWLRINRTPEVGPVTFRALQKRFIDPEEAIKYLENKNKKIPTISEIEDEIIKIRELGASLIFIDDPEYPELLKEIPDSPPFLTVSGRLSLLKNKLISIVGSRSSSLAGNQIARQFGQGLVSAGYTVVSGLARGIDRHVHLGGIESTIAVIANGIDQVYPLENLDLYNTLKQSGLIVTEAPLGTPPEGRLFHARNRIIAGLSGFTIVVEATQNSGSLITAQYALDYNREIFAVPGCPLDARADGPNTLIQNGATLIRNVQDILKYIKSDIIVQERCRSQKIEDMPNQIARRTGEQKTSEPSEDYASSLKINLLILLSKTPIHVDELQRVLGCEISLIRSLLVELEVEGKITQIPGNRVIIN